MLREIDGVNGTPFNQTQYHTHTSTFEHNRQVNRSYTPTRLPHVLITAIFRLRFALGVPRILIRQTRDCQLPS